MTQIVVGVDGSQHSEVALRWAAREAELRGGGLSALTAVLVWELFNQRHADGSTRFDPEYDDTKADAALLATLEDARGAEAAASVVRRTIVAVPAPGLLEAAKGADLLVVGARGLGGFRGLLLGSVSQQALQHATGPVAVVRSSEDPDDASGATPRPGERIVVGVDGSDSSGAATSWAVTEARLRGGALQAVHAWEVPAIYGPVGIGFPYDTSGLESAARELLDEVVDGALAVGGGADDAPVVERIVSPGGPAASILEAAAGADLVVIGRRGLGGFQRLLLGSVSEHVARHAPCPVVVMPPTTAGAD
ncbi:MAG: universal stress protein [Acidimicrobiales bacterium]|nr:universal stress protein [Acidimicrobiales bacterium]